MAVAALGVGGAVELHNLLDAKISKCVNCDQNATPEVASAAQPMVEVDTVDSLNGTKCAVIAAPGSVKEHIAALEPGAAICLVLLGAEQIGALDGKIGQLESGISTGAIQLYDYTQKYTGQLLRINIDAAVTEKDHAVTCNQPVYCIGAAPSGIAADGSQPSYVAYSLPPETERGQHDAFMNGLLDQYARQLGTKPLVSQYTASQIAGAV
ncbi:MAG TPA: hypothetical protein VHC98_00215 [Candidatus Saccharimonadales bacterium]|nr:hypothetical protein [Candidatus Saccharimonadales bacterium]